MARARTPVRSPRVAIIGAGVSGIGMAARLKAAGVESFRLYEKADDLGGTWRANTYPGLSCDVPSRYYSYSFAPNPAWASQFSPGREIWSYLDGIAESLDLRSHISFDSEVDEAEWRDGSWHLRTKSGEEGEYDFIVSAAGGLVHTVKPDIPGLDSFEGACFHSAEWDHSVPLEGKRIGVIGTGSTGTQITRALAPVAGRFELYQRTPQWILPVPNHRYSSFTRRAYRRFPALNRFAYRFWQLAFEKSLSHAMTKPGLRRRLVGAACRLHLRRVRDPELRRRFTPSYEPMCKRLVMGSNFYRQFERPNVELVDQGIDRVEPGGIVTADGRLHELDVLVLATGFDAQAFLRPVELIGQDGLRLSDVWKGEPRAYRTVALPGFPNFLMLLGPHSPFGNQSMFTVSETQARFAMQCIELWREGEVDSMSPTDEATDRFNERLRAEIPDTIWASGCSSWYIGKDGLPFVWPWSPEKHRELLSALELEDWTVEALPSV